MSFQIAGRIAFVTGANRGIGRALVDALLERGSPRIYAGTRRPEELADLAAASGGRVVPVRLDVTSPDDIKAAAGLATDASILVNNAGVALQFGSAFTDAAWLSAGREEFEVNVLGTLAVTQAFAPVLARQGGGAVVNLSSVAGLVPFAAFVSYSASKAAVHSLTQVTRAILSAQGTFVAGVYPGPIDTEMAGRLTVPKATPRDAAHAILDGIEAGREEIFPDPTAQQLGALYLQNPKALEQQVSAAAAA
jgi:NAD(P)-dependent dehydrogenase (short-subunit alcohol dehydrogenase family)